MDLHEQNMHKLSLYYVTLTNYDETYKKSRLQQRQHYGNFRRSFRKANKTQIRIAETEKYPRYFFLSVDEEPFIGESRILKNSQK
jgi:2,3-bisphosphoglycerate-independent phosphoglycerate mutase